MTTSGNKLRHRHPGLQCIYWVTYYLLLALLLVNTSLQAAVYVMAYTGTFPIDTFLVYTPENGPPIYLHREMVIALLVMNVASYVLFSLMILMTRTRQFRIFLASPIIIVNALITAFAGPILLYFLFYIFTQPFQSLDWNR